LVVFLLPVFFFGDNVSAEKQVLIKEIRFSERDDTTRVVVEFDSMPDFSTGLLHDPERLYFDFKDAELLSPINKKTFKSRRVKAVRFGRPSPGILRMVVDLRSKLPHKFFKISSPPRLVIDFGEDRNPFYREKKIVVIDPGHGGDDPGAIGPGGLKEKDVTLAIARYLKRILEERYNLRVYLTREDDRYLELKERTKIANKKAADLFVSIHANASPRRKASGIETYLLNWTNDKEAMRVAARENQISIEKLKQQQSELGMILASLKRENKRDESLKLAHYIQHSLVMGLRPHYHVKDLGVKQALFYVLVGADMPSVLVEVGFISNPKEERLLRSNRFRRKTAEAIATGIFRYILSLPDAPKLALQNENLPKL